MPLGIWRPAADPGVLIGRTRRARTGDANALDIRALDQSVTVLSESAAAEHVVIADGPRRLRLELRGASVLDGPVVLHLLIDTSELDRRIEALRRLAGLMRTGRLLNSLYPPDPRAARLALALAAWDAARAGASQRGIIGRVLNEALVAGDLTDERRFDSLRMRVARLLKQAEARIEAGGRQFLGG